MASYGRKSLDLYFGGSWNFVSTGPTNSTPYDIYGGQPYNTADPPADAPRLKDLRRAGT